MESTMRDDTYPADEDVIELGAASELTKGGVEKDFEDPDPLI